MTIAHLLLALSVVIVWGANFVIIKFGLGEFPPLLLATLRFSFSCLPWLLFIRRPPVPWRLLVGNGVFLGFGLFGILFIAMRADISPGIASLLVQTQAFFTIGLSLLLLGERVRIFQLVGFLLSVAGLAMFFLHVDATTTLRGLLLTLACGFSWALANLIVKRASVHVQSQPASLPSPASSAATPPKNLDMLAFMVWSSVFAVPPLLAASLWLDGPDRIATALVQADAIGWISALWQGVANTLFGYGAWNWLLARYPAATISPLSLLVPVFGMATAALVYAEPLPAWKLEGGTLVLLGLLTITLWPRLRARFIAAAV